MQPESEKDEERNPFLRRQSCESGTGTPYESESRQDEMDPQLHTIAAIPSSTAAPSFQDIIGPEYIL